MLGLNLRGPAVPAGPAGDAGPFRVLVCLFLRRFLENDLLSGDGDARVNLGMIVGLLAAPGAFTLAFLTLSYAGPFITPSERLVMALDHKYQFLLASMILAALAAALEWDALVLDGRDLAILGPLPVPRARLLGAKLAALGLFLLALGAAVNLIPTLGFPVVWLSLVPLGPGHGAWLTLVHGTVSLAAAVLGFFAVVAVRALVALLCPRRLRAASTLVQSVLILCLGTLFLLSPMLPADVRGALEQPTRATRLNPAMWMLGGYEWLTAPGLYASPRFTGPATWTFWERQQLRRERNLGPEVWAHPLPLFRTEAAARRRYEAMRPTLDGLALTGAVAFPAVAACALGLHLLAYARRGGRQEEGRGGHRRRVALEGGGVAHATFAFTLQALVRNGPQRLPVAGALAFGGALAILFGGLAAGPVSLPSAPGSALLALEYLVGFFALAGVRRAFAIPAALEANWVFRLSLDGADRRPAVAGVRRAVAAGLVLPLVAAAALVHGCLWGTEAAAAHLVEGSLLSLVLVEVLLAGFDRVPFTSAYAPPDARARWPFQLAAVVLFAYLCGAIEAAGSSGLAGVAAVGAGAAGTIAGIRWIARRWPIPDRRLTFEQRPDEAVQTLGIPLVP